MEAAQKGCTGPPLHLRKPYKDMTAETKITKTIRVSIDVKQHLDEMKGSVSASEFIETMLSYFERNGVDPRTSINGKFKTLELQGIERIIKIIRAIEKDKIDKLLPAPEAHSDDLLKRADKQVTQLKAEVERLKKASAPDVEAEGNWDRLSGCWKTLSTRRTSRRRKKEQIILSHRFIWKCCYIK